MGIGEIGKICVVGGAGFLGTSLCRLLEEAGQEFEIVDIKPSKTFPCRSRIADICDIDELEACVDGDVVVHLAAVHRDDVTDKDAYERVNVRGTDNLIKVCQKKGISKIIFTSSVAVYGFNPAPANESSQINFFNDYGRTKFAAEERLRAWKSSGEHSLIIIRPAVIFGKGNRGNVYNLLRQIASRRFLMIGSGLNRKSMAYVENVATFILRCMTVGHVSAIYNYSDGPALTVRELVMHAREVMFDNKSVGLSLPFGFGLLAGYLADLASFATGKALPISAIRIKKFAAPSEISSIMLPPGGFEAPYALLDSLSDVIKAEFLADEFSGEIFWAE